MEELLPDSVAAVYRHDSGIHKILSCSFYDIIVKYSKTQRTWVSFMIKNNQKVFNRMHVVMDAVITVFSYALAYFIKFYILNADTIGVGVLPPRDYFVVLLLLIPKRKHWSF